MLKRALRFAALAGALVLGTGTGAWAAFDDFNFTTTVATGATPPGTLGGFGTSASVVQGSTTVTLMAQDGTGLATPTSIVFGRIAATPPAANTTEAVNLDYDFRLVFTADATGSGPSADPVTFTIDILGNISGTITGNSNGSTAYNLSNTFMPTPSVYSVDVPGRGTYVITADAYTAPGSAAGAFGASVRATLVPTAPVPEPASLVLVGLGGLGVLGWARRRRRRAA